MPRQDYVLMTVPMLLCDSRNVNSIIQTLWLNPGSDKSTCLNQYFDRENSSVLGQWICIMFTPNRIYKRRGHRYCT
jgi:hypothetical protein